MEGPVTPRPAFLLLGSGLPPRVLAFGGGCVCITLASFSGEEGGSEARAQFSADVNNEIGAGVVAIRKHLVHTDRGEPVWMGTSVSG